MEQKVQVLVDNVTDSARTVLNLIPVDKQGTAPAAAASEVFNGEKGVGGVKATGTAAKAATAGDDDDNSATTRAARDASSALKKDLGQLRRLVQAAIGALRIAEKEDDERTREITAAHHATTTVAVRESTAATSLSPAATSTGNRDKTDGKANVTGSRDQINSGERTGEDFEEQTPTDTVDEGSPVLLRSRDEECDVQSSSSCSIRPEAGIGGGAGVGTPRSSGLPVAAGHEDSFSQLETSNDGIGDDMTSPCQGRIAPGEEAYRSVIGVEDFARGGSSMKPGDLRRGAVEVGGEDGDAYRGDSRESEDGGGERGSEM